MVFADQALKRSIPTENTSTRLSWFAYFASTGVNALETITPNSEFRSFWKSIAGTAV